MGGSCCNAGRPTGSAPLRTTLQLQNVCRERALQWMIGLHASKKLIPLNDWLILVHVDHGSHTQNIYFIAY